MLLPEVQAKAWESRLENHNHNFSSVVEKEILTWVKQYYPSAHSSHTHSKQLDVYIEEINLAIEYNGLYWHSEGCPAPKDNHYHIDKQKHIKEHKNARTIFVWEHEWRDRQSQVKNFLLAAMKISTLKVGARKCTFQPIDPTQAAEFVCANHIQPIKAQSVTYAIGCYHNSELLSVATFGVHHRNNKEVVLSRFVCLPGVHIQGGLSKISKLAYEYFQKPIVSWADLMKSEGNGYLQAGWKLDQVLPPDYFYASKGGKMAIPKQARQKRRVNTPEGMTESEHAILDGLSRVWDCGKLRFVYDPYREGSQT